MSKLNYNRSKYDGPKCSESGSILKRLIRRLYTQRILYQTERIKIKIRKEEHVGQEEQRTGSRSKVDQTKTHLAMSCSLIQHTTLHTKIQNSDDYCTSR
jgi:hypothetical protein